MLCCATLPSCAALRAPAADARAAAAGPRPGSPAVIGNGPSWIIIGGRGCGEHVAPWRALLLCEGPAQIARLVVPVVVDAVEGVQRVPGAVPLCRPRAEVALDPGNEGRSVMERSVVHADGPAAVPLVAAASRCSSGSLCGSTWKGSMCIFALRGCSIWKPVPDRRADVSGYQVPLRNAAGRGPQVFAEDARLIVWLDGRLARRLVELLCGSCQHERVGQLILAQQFCCLDTRKGTCL